MRNQAINEMISTAKELSNIRQALDQAAIVAITDQAGIITHVNDKFCEISKYPREELIGKNHRIINSGYHPKEFFIEMWKTISNGLYWEAEICNRAKDGSIYWVNTTIAPFLNENGKPYQYVSIRYEITQRKKAEEELKVMLGRLERSNQELQDFASIAAHDLQEPLRKIQTFGDRLLTQSSADLSPESNDYLARMLASAGRMRKLIDDLLTYSRVTSKGDAFQITNLNHILRDVVADLEVRIESSNGEVIVNPLPEIEADPSQMRQLFQNLIANGLKFHVPGSEPLVTVSASLEGNVCIITVTDNGIGFDEKYLDRIFVIFQRLHGRQEYQGTGVGLAVCRRIVDRHGGSITASSSPNQGAKFIITLPIKQTGNNTK